MMGRIASKPANRTHYYGQDAGIELAAAASSWSTTRTTHSAMASTGDWDLVCCGHDHKADIRTIDNLAGKQHLAGESRHGRRHQGAGHLDTGRPRQHAVLPARSAVVAVSRQPGTQQRYGKQ